MCWYICVVMYQLIFSFPFYFIISINSKSLTDICRNFFADKMGIASFKSLHDFIIVSLKLSSSSTFSCDDVEAETSSGECFSSVMEPLSGVFFVLGIVLPSFLLVIFVVKGPSPCWISFVTWGLFVLLMERRTILVVFLGRLCVGREGDLFRFEETLNNKFE